MFEVVFLSAAMSVDAFGLGIALGIKGIKFRKVSAVVMSIETFLIIMVCVFLGDGVRRFLPSFTGNLVLIAMGLWIIWESMSKGHTDSSTVKIMRRGYESDRDKSGDIDVLEAFFLALAMSIDSVGICIGASSIEHHYLMPLGAVISQLAFMVAGIKAGGKIGKSVDTRLCSVASGIIIMLLGLIGL